MSSIALNVDQDSMSPSVHLPHENTRPLNGTAGTNHDWSTAQNEGIAIVGLGCRLPGDISSASELWEFLKDGKTGRCEIPESRFNIDAFHDSRPNRQGSLAMRTGYFIDQDLRDFDNGFFGINSVEALHMDAQQRMLLEVVYECLESSGAKLEKIAGANVGCFVGNFTTDNQIMQSRDWEYSHRYTATGIGTTILSNRINHVFDLKGPSVTIDTACSSSLYCLHLAYRAIQNGDCDSAVVAAANLIQTPEQYISTAAAGVLSDTGACHTFAADADGYSRADAIGSLYLKRYSDALRDNDPIRSIIRGTAINANGRTPGITMPSSAGQEAVVTKAYDHSGVRPEDISYVECHGTGTPVGDPIEVAAVANFCKQLTSATFKHGAEPLLIGSVKSNFGHSEAASGITSIIKTTLALEHFQIPATVGIQKLNPTIPWKEYNVDVVQSLVPWPKRSHLSSPTAGVNSFGYGGANAHCILQRANHEVQANWYQSNGHIREEQSQDQSFLIPISAKSENATKTRLNDIASLDLSKIEPADLAYTLCERRSSFDWRGYLICKPDESAAYINANVAVNTIRQSQSSDIPLAFVFTGQGAQWPQMGKELIERCALLNRSLDTFEGYLKELPTPPEWSLKEMILAPEAESQISDPAISQIACTALQLAFFDLLSSWEILPSVVIGHSSGELAAAYAAGHLSAFEAIAAAYLRGQVVNSADSSGAMIAVGLSSDEANQRIQAQNLSNHVSVACFNSPENVTLSGDAYEVEWLLQSLQSDGIFARKLKTSGKAYHSKQMKQVGEMYETQLAATFHRSHKDLKTLKNHDAARNLPTMISTVFNEPIQGRSSCGASYWRANLESPVQFNSALESLLSKGDCHLVEIGPHSALELPINQTKVHLKKESGFNYLSALHRNKDSETNAVSLAGDLWTLGYPVNFSRINRFDHETTSEKRSVLTNLPNYPWDHSHKFWKEPRSSYEFRHRRFARDDLLGSLVPGSNGITSTWRNLLGTEEVSWLRDHKLANDAVFPAAGYVALASRAAQQIALSLENSILEIQNMHIMEAMILKEKTRIELFTELVPISHTDLDHSSSAWHFTISTFDAGQSTRHACGKIAFIPSQGTLRSSRNIAGDQITSQHKRVWYSQFSKVGMNFGPKFHSLSEVFIPRMKNATISSASLAPLPDSVKDEHCTLYPFEIHPIVLDAQLQSGLIACAAGIAEDLVARIPTFVERVQIWPDFQSGPLDQCIVEATSKTVGFGIDILSSEMLDKDRNLVARFCDVKAALFHGTLGENQVRHPMLRVQWQPDLSKLSKSNSPALKILIEKDYRERRERVLQPHVGALQSILRLLSHSSGPLDILQLGSYSKAFTAELMDCLDAGSSFQRYRSYNYGEYDTEPRIRWRAMERDGIPDSIPPFDAAKSADERMELFDVIICEDPQDMNRLKLPASLTHYLKPYGKLLSVGKMSSKMLKQLGCSALEINPESTTPITLAFFDSTVKESKANGLSSSSSTMLVTSNPTHPLNQELARRLQTNAISLGDLDFMDVPGNAIIILTAELEDPILSTPSENQFAEIQKITNHASKIVWVTGANLTQSQKPDISIIYGLARTLMSERPSLKISVIDIDDAYSNVSSTASNLLSVLEQEATSSGSMDREYLQREGILYVSRLITDEQANSTFRERKLSKLTRKPLSTVGSSRLSIQEPGQMDTLHLVSNKDTPSLPSDHVEVMVKAVGVNAKDLYTLSGKIETVENTCCCEFSGVITRVGCKVSNFSIGDRVLANAPSHSGTFEQVPAWACCRIHSHESFTQMAGVSAVFMTAVLGLRDKAALQPCESVLIHSAAGGVGIAAILLAKDIGAKIFATVGTAEKKNYLTKNFGLNPEHIFNSRDTSFVSQIMAATDNGGVDVVLNSLTGERLHASLEVCAKFGRFIEIGKRDILDAGKMNMRVFERCITFSAFDLHELYYSEANQAKYGSLVQDAVALYRKVGAPTPTVFDVNEISAAFRLFSKGTRIGKIVVSFEDPKSLVLHKPPKFATRFLPEKSYLLVGCLGGLGRSIARYMFSQGARHFSFIGRSGIDKAPAASLVADLEQLGATVNVIRGDVQDYNVVEEAVNQMRYPLGGVVQAAMALAESLFTSMQHSQWTKVLGPKVQGTWNIHRAISGKDQNLDFFLMTSSLSGTVFSPTEGNYCAANCFLDHFAAYRRSLGLPATSLGLGQMEGIGYIYEHPDIEQMLARRGITGLSEDDMLLFIDIALSSSYRQEADSSVFSRSLAQTDAHIVTGIEPTRMGELWDQGYELSLEMFREDPRFNILALAAPTNKSLKAVQTGDNTSGRQTGLPEEVRKALATKDSSEILKAVFEVLAERLSHLILMPLERISPQLKFLEIGMDSMLAAEYRTFVFNALGVDVPFFTLIDSKSRMSDVVGLVCRALRP